MLRAWQKTDIGGVTDVVIGRRLWQEWSDYWPEADDPFAAWINPVRKHVVTSTVVEGDPVAYVQKLQQQGDGGISVAGGIETIRSLFLADVIDALTLTVHPVAPNEGRRLFDESVPLTRLALLDATSTSAGNAILTYGLRSETRRPSWANTRAIARPRPPEADGECWS